MRDLRLFVLLAVLPGSIGTRSALAQRPLEAAVDSVMRAATARGPIAGASIGVRLGAAFEYVQGYGFADLEHRVPAGPATVYRIGSITKQFTAAAVMRQVDAGHVSLDDPLTRFLPTYPTQGHTVTLHHLLTHTSGIRSYTGLGERWLEKMPLELTSDELIALFRDEPFDFAPGERYRYSNSGYYLLGVILDSVVDMPYATYVETELARPLGLESTWYCDVHRVIPHRAQGYTRSDGTFQRAEPLGMSQPGAAGALCSTAGDLLAWNAALVNGRVVSAGAYARMITPARLNDSVATDYGYGLAVGERDGRRVIEHGGGINGFSSHLAWYPDDTLTVVVLANTQEATAGVLARDLARVALGVSDPEGRDLPVTRDDIARYRGTYDLGLLALRVFEANGSLNAQGTNQPAFRLLSQGNHAFVAEFDRSVRIEFHVTNGRATALTLYQAGRATRAERVEGGR